jgi:hypothetical protein
MTQALLASYGALVGNDPNFSSVVLLLPCDGTNGGTSFPDAGPVPQTVSASGGGVTTDTSTVKYGSASASMVLSSAAHGLRVPHASSLNLPGDFTIEGWVRYSVAMSASQWSPIFAAKRNTSTQWEYWFGALADALYFTWSTNGTTLSSVNVSWTPSLNVWYHVAACRSGSNLRFFVDGTQQGATQTVSGTIWSDTRDLSIGSDSINVPSFTGFLDDIRITKGVARYTSNFTPPAAALPRF